MLTSRELHQEVGSRGAGPVASTEGKLAHLAATSMTAALAQDCMHHWMPYSSLHLQLWSTRPAQHLPWHLMLSPSTTLIYTTFLTHSDVPCNPTSLPGRSEVLQLRTWLGLAIPMMQAPPVARPLTYFICTVLQCVLLEA